IQKKIERLLGVFMGTFFHQLARRNQMAPQTLVGDLIFQQVHFLQEQSEMVSPQKIQPRQTKARLDFGNQFRQKFAAHAGDEKAILVHLTERAQAQLTVGLLSAKVLHAFAHAQDQFAYDLMNLGRKTVKIGEQTFAVGQQQTLAFRQLTRKIIQQI